MIYNCITKTKEVTLSTRDKMKLRFQMATLNLRECQGISTIEIILVLVVLIALVIIFRDQLMGLINSIFERVTSDSAGI